MISESSIEDRERYVHELAQYIADRRITLEICLTSNLQTNPSIKSLSQHAFGAMRDARLSTTFCTDNRLVSNTTVTNEISLAINHLNLSPADLKRSLIYGFKRSFFPGTYLKKRQYVRKIIDYYERLEQEYPVLRGENPTD
jgi:adenosine deaminase